MCAAPSLEWVWCLYVLLGPPTAIRNELPSCILLEGHRIVSERCQPHR